MKNSIDLERETSSVRKGTMINPLLTARSTSPDHLRRRVRPGGKDKDKQIAVVEGINQRFSVQDTR